MGAALALLPEAVAEVLLEMSVITFSRFAIAAVTGKVTSMYALSDLDLAGLIVGAGTWYNKRRCYSGGTFKCGRTNNRHIFEYTYTSDKLILLPI